MKTWILIILIVVLILVFNGVASRQLETVTERLNRQVEELTRAVEEENWQQAQAIQEQLFTEWEQSRHSLQKYLDHSELETVDIVMVRVKAMTYACEKSDLIPELSELSRDIIHLTQRYELALENVF